MIWNEKKYGIRYLVITLLLVGYMCYLEGEEVRQREQGAAVAGRGPRRRLGLVVAAALGRHLGRVRVRVRVRVMVRVRVKGER